MIFITEMFGSNNDTTDEIRRRYNRYNTANTKGLGSGIGALYGGALGMTSGNPVAAALGTAAGGTLGYIAGARAKRHIDDRDELMRRDMKDAMKNK